VKVSILYFGQFISQEEAQAFAAEQYVRVERLGHSLFIDIPQAAAGRYHPGAIHQEIVVSIPDRLNVEVARCTGDLLIRLPRLRSDWYINHPRGSVEVRMQEPGGYQSAGGDPGRAEISREILMGQCSGK
jgi:hypothetical protein